MHGRTAQRRRRGGAAQTTEELFPGADGFARRLLASAMGLPRVCTVKKCRRRKRCFGLGLVCFEEHRGLARKRLRAALARLGWRDAEGA